MLEELLQLQEIAVEEILATNQLKALEDLRVKYLGRKSRLRNIMSSLGGLPRINVPKSDKPLVKRRRESYTNCYCYQPNESNSRNGKNSSYIDITLPGRVPDLGAPHPLIRLSYELTDIFRGMGFELFEGPETEDEYHNFDALNTPKDHPARDLDTLKRADYYEHIPRLCRFVSWKIASHLSE